MQRFLISRSLLAGTLALGFGGLAACNSGAMQAEEASAAAPTQMASGSGAMTSSVPTVGGASMYPNRNIVQNAAESADHTTLVTAVKTAGLVETLSGPGPFTVFAPTNAAFAKLPDGTVDTLVQPPQRQQLTGILTYHVVPGRVTAADLVRRIQAGNGSATLTTVNGARLTARAANGGVQLTDAAGGMAMVTQADVLQSNGVIHVIDTVLMPKAG